MVCCYGDRLMSTHAEFPVGIKSSFTHFNLFNFRIKTNVLERDCKDEQHLEAVITAL